MYTSTTQEISHQTQNYTLTPLLERCFQRSEHDQTKIIKSFPSLFELNTH